ncbi:hypothetical protein BDY21DRAFT_318718 [Lineolata rhizophorae]|uniref:Uncharacterized protein n=1 Tax=Lineolata rhizophorae TaxID=578093 RepID=A0A6A6P3E9_9PEZI|nr:hypothetical protein BDY21DRAFT_318718 [Lineolata rhizophorae]
MALNTDIATRALIISLKSASCSKTTAKISTITGVPKRTIQAIFSRAVKQGFDLNTTLIIVRDEYVIDTPRSGRLTK